MRRAPRHHERGSAGAGAPDDEAWAAADKPTKRARGHYEVEPVPRLKPEQPAARKMRGRATVGAAVGARGMETESSQHGVAEPDNLRGCAPLSPRRRTPQSSQAGPSPRRGGGGRARRRARGGGG